MPPRSHLWPPLPLHPDVQRCDPWPLSPWRVVGSPFLPHSLAVLGGGQGLRVTHSGLSLGGWRP